MTVDLISELRALISVLQLDWNSWNMCLLAFCSFFLVWSAANIISCIFRWIGGGFVVLGF